MSNKANRQGPAKVIGRLAGEPESSALHDSALDAGTSINGAPPIMGIGDAQVKLVQVRCYCGHVVAELWFNERSERTGRASFWSLLAEVTEDADARPVDTRLIRNIVRPGARLIADCPAHGRRELDADALLRHGRRAQALYEADRLPQVRRFILPRP